MAARTLNAKTEVQLKWILMTYITINFSSSVLDSLYLFICSLVLISVSDLYSNNFIMCVFAVTNPFGKKEGPAQMNKINSHHSLNPKVLELLNYVFGSFIS